MSSRSRTQHLRDTFASWRSAVLPSFEVSDIYVVPENVQSKSTAGKTGRAHDQSPEVQFIEWAERAERRIRLDGDGARGNTSVGV